MITWLADAQAGDCAAFEQIHAALTPLLTRFVRRITESETEDIVQETLIALYQTLDQVQSIAHLRPYVLRIARNRCYDRLRHWRRFEHVSIDADDPEALPTQRVNFALRDQGDSPEDATHWLLLKLEVEQAMSRLPHAQRESLMLYAEEGLTYDEIAQVLEISIGTVKSRIFHAKKALRRLIRPEILIAIQQS
jgi:RNA polymerase sigma-70 factor (ECF subfamily)